jgi:hypothetical protein
MRSKIINKILKRINLKTQLRISNQTAFIMLLSELGYREDKMWTDEENEILEKLCLFAEKHTDDQLKTIKEKYWIIKKRFPFISIYKK